MAACRAPPMIMGCNCATQAGVELFSKTHKKERPREAERSEEGGKAEKRANNTVQRIHAAPVGPVGEGARL